MKKGILMVLLIMLCACSNTSATDGYVSTNVTEILNKIANKDTFILLIESDECYSCTMLREDMDATVEEATLTIYTLNDSEISDAEKDQLNIAVGDYTSWPTLIYVQEGEISQLNHYEYSTDPEGWETWLANMNIIEK